MYTLIVYKFNFTFNFRQLNNFSHSINKKIIKYQLILKIKKN